MSSPPLNQVQGNPRIWSLDRTDSDLHDSDQESSSVIRLPPTNFPELNKNFGYDVSPPPLPPKPVFGRGDVELPFPLPSRPDFIRMPPAPQSAPPPLPPKPEFIKVDNPHGSILSRKSHPIPSSLPQLSPAAKTPEQGKLNETKLNLLGLPPPPTRPLPAAPRSDRKPSFGEEGSWVPGFQDGRGPIDPLQPPEPTIISDGDVYRSSIGMEAGDLSSPYLSGQLPRLKPSFPHPPYPLRTHRVSSLFQTLNLSNESGNDKNIVLLTLSAETAEDAMYGAFAASRVRETQSVFVDSLRAAPVPWRPYEKIVCTGQTWSVLHEYLTNNSLKTHGRNKALLLLTGYVVGACLNGKETGINLLTEIVRRMRGAERSERDGSVFTLLVNIAAHACFVKNASWSRVEEVARNVFSDVVEDMHGRQDDDVMWERALRCYLFLLKSSVTYPSINISSKCLAALALRKDDLTHTDIDHVLITEGLCPRLHQTWDEFLTSAKINMGCVDEINGLSTILTLFADTSSPTARRSLFVLIYDIAVLKCLEGLTEDVVIRLRENVDIFRALLEGHEMADVLTHVFKIGPWKGFIVDILRVLLFNPLSKEYLGSIVNYSLDEQQPIEKKAFQEKTGNTSVSEVRLGSQIGKAYRAPTSQYISSTRGLLKYLDKVFCTKVLREMKGMAAHHAKLYSQRETMHYAREWRILREARSEVLMFTFSRKGDMNASLTSVLNKIYVSVMEITSGRCSMKGLLYMCEMIIEFLTVSQPFASRGNSRAGQVDSIPKLFLKGLLSVPRRLIQECNPSMFSLLLLASATKVSSKRMSESRQCLVEFLAVSKDGLGILRPFADDNDAIVAYRAAEIVNKHNETSTTAANAAQKSKS